MVSAKTYEQEVSSGERFKFGENWTHFLLLLNEERIQQAISSLTNMLEVESLEGKSFLDIGSGSGLFSLAAKRLGARVFSFDYDPQSVACTKELKSRYYENDSSWQVDTRSVMDKEYLNKLGKFDIVYSWGVLHHTGDMWTALDNVANNVAPHGKLFIALYNDQGGASKRWLKIKQIYNKLPIQLRPIFAAFVYFPREFRFFLIHLVRREPLEYFSSIINYSKTGRGMSWWHDLIDWIGGYPFEVSKPDQIFDFYKSRDFKLITLKTCAGGLGCNEFVFQRNK
ncbi:MAG TPA: methyltransferase domain-containing protein [Nitrospira sp.]|nr:methyltransferase domain-containing protein [Nitrospira sp.]